METLVTFSPTSEESSGILGINPGLMKAVVISDNDDYCDIMILEHVDEDLLDITVTDVWWGYLKELEVKDEEAIDLKVRNNEVEKALEFETIEPIKSTDSLTKKKLAIGLI